MGRQTTSRRNFLTVASAGIAGGALGVGARAVQAQSGNSSANIGGYDVRAFGAKGDGTTIDSPAINKAIDKATAEGGGTVRFPPGTYLCYSIRLKSNITL